MFTKNDYYDGKVTSLGFQMEDGPATVGVMAVGEYEFSTSRKELVTITSGSVSVLLPRETLWRSFSDGQTFSVPPESTFVVRVERETSYLCRYR